MFNSAGSGEGLGDGGDEAAGVGAVGVEVRVEVGDAGTDQGRGAEENPHQIGETLPVEPLGLRVGHGSERRFIQGVEIQVQPNRPHLR